MISSQFDAYFAQTRRPRGFFSGMPLFFKLWFALVACIAIAGLSLYGYLAYTVITQVSSTSPDDVGRMIGSVIGSVMRGYNEVAR